MRYWLTMPGEQIYCPFHKRWEVYTGEDERLCDWCCMEKPCPMHGDGLLPIAEERRKEEGKEAAPYKWRWKTEEEVVEEWIVLPIVTD